MTSSSGGEEVEGSEVFEINDFTVVTPMEHAIAALESVLHDWQIKKCLKDVEYEINRTNINSCEWSCKTTSISLNGEKTATVNVSHYKPILPVVSDAGVTMREAENQRNSLTHVMREGRALLLPELDFCPSSIIANQFGVLEFLLITPYDWKNNKITDESQLRCLLSVVQMTLSTTECEIPVFVQFGEPERQLYFGACINSSMQIDFDSAHLLKIQSKHMHLSGILDMFREEMNVSSSISNPVRVSVQVDYHLQEDLKSPNFPSPSLFDLVDGDEADIAKMVAGRTVSLPFGASSDVLCDFSVSALWLNQEERILNETESYSDLDPNTAPVWKAFATFVSGFPCLLYMTVKKLIEVAESDEGKLRVTHSRRSLEDVIGVNARQALSPLAPPTVVIADGTEKADVDRPIKQSELAHWLDAIFSRQSSSLSASLDVASETMKRDFSSPGMAVKETSPPSDVEEVDVKDKNSDGTLRLCMKKLKSCKSAPAESLVERIALVLTYILSFHESQLAAFEQMWCAIVKELRDYWDSNRDLPDMESGMSPDLSACLLHQKLQMLQCCIESRSRRHHIFDKSDKIFNSVNQEDVFFDASDQWMSDDEDGSSSNPRDCDNGRNCSREPQGRLKPLDSLHLIQHHEVQLYEPITQERCPMTEDMLARYTGYLSALDSGSRVNAQLDVLRSDMQAFKAANPQCIFEDFVRWHSPKDYTYDENSGIGSLSSRMQGNDNIWVQTWKDAVPMPAVLQARIFNDSKEAEFVGIHSHLSGT